MFSELTTWYLITNWCALLWGRPLSHTLSAFLSYVVLFFKCYIKHINLVYVSPWWNMTASSSHNLLPILTPWSSHSFSSLWLISQLLRVLASLPSLGMPSFFPSLLSDILSLWAPFPGLVLLLYSYETIRFTFPSFPVTHSWS